MFKLTNRTKKNLRLVFWYMDPSYVNAVVDRVAALDDLNEFEIFGVAHAVLAGHLEELDG